MAWLERPPSGIYSICFRFGGRKYKRSLDTANLPAAERSLQYLKENLKLVENGRLDLPPGCDPRELLLSNAKLSFAASGLPNGRKLQGPPPSFSAEQLAWLAATSGPQVAPVAVNQQATQIERQLVPPPAEPTLLLGNAFEEYLAKLPEHALGAETIRVARIHFANLKRILGEKTPLAALDKPALQGYVTERGKATGRRGKPLSTTTIKKELGTLSSLWSWAKEHRFVTREFPAKHLRFAATADKPPFQTLAEVERKIALGHLSAEDQEELWDCVFLTLPEIEELLRHVQRHALHPFLYPMFVFAAHTGARRSEMRRSVIQDLDFEGRRINLRERKRVQGRHTLRSVPMSAPLEAALRAWLLCHPGGRFTFCLGRNVPKSRKLRSEPLALTCEEAGHHFQQALLGSKWERLRGWHVFRHSFCSNAAAQGVDQRIINHWVGHQTEEMTRRYRHMNPVQERAAIQQVFGSKEYSATT